MCGPKQGKLVCQWRYRITEKRCMFIVWSMHVKVFYSIQAPSLPQALEIVSCSLLSTVPFLANFISPTAIRVEMLLQCHGPAHMEPYGSGLCSSLTPFFFNGGHTSLLMLNSLCLWILASNDCQRLLLCFIDYYQKCKSYPDGAAKWIIIYFPVIYLPFGLL